VTEESAVPDPTARSTTSHSLRLVLLVVLSVLLLASVAAVAYLAAVVALFYRRRTGVALATLGAGAMAVWALAWIIYLPRAQYLRVSVRTADVLRLHGATGPRQVQMLDYKEPSLAFYQGGTIREDAATRLTQNHIDSGTPWYVITSDVWDKTEPQVRERFDVIDRVIGFAYAGGRRVEVLVVRARTAGPSSSHAEQSPTH
jgi:hypothetical protein